MSITEAAGKRREIVVPGRAKPKEKDKKKMDKPQGPISARGSRIMIWSTELCHMVTL